MLFQTSSNFEEYPCRSFQNNQKSRSTATVKLRDDKKEPQKRSQYGLLNENLVMACSLDK